MRAPTHNLNDDAFLLLDHEWIVDLFAGGGGASLGIEMALGRSPNVAVNHDAPAVAMHKANHPDTEHYLEDIFDVDPRVVCRGNAVGLLWASPDCTDHSRAKNGSITRNRRVRCLANVLHHWAATVRPRVMVLECVEELADWGPLDDEGKIVKSRKGESFQDWWVRLERMGYRLSKRSLSACDFGAPTSRKRMYIIARCDGIDPEDCWPEATHGPGRAQPWRTAAECIDYSLPCPSIFMTKVDAKKYTIETGIRLKRPLVDKTMQRIRRGIYKYVLECARPFIVPVSHGGVGRNDHRNRGEFGLVAPTLVQTGYGERVGQAPRCLDLGKPLGTVISGGTGGNGKHALVAAFLGKGYSERSGGWNGGQALDAPAGTITTRDHHNLVLGHMVKLRGTSDAHMEASSLHSETPCPTVSAGGNHIGEVRAFLSKYYGNGTPESLTEPLDTITTKDRFGLVVVDGEQYQIVDIGFRMLEPRELFTAQGFPRSYIIDPICTRVLEYKHKRTGRIVRRTVTGPLTETMQVEKCGNSVSPPVACSIVRSVFAKQPAMRMAA
jgi:DNA (cytosine-5)-methyltransferase 1